MTDRFQISDSDPSSLKAAARQLASLPGVYDTVPVGLCLIDRDLRFVSINRRMAEMMGRPAEADIGRGLAEVTPDIAAQLEPQLRRALRGERVSDLELRGTQAGTICEGPVFLVSLETVRGEDGKIGGVLCSALDITKRKRAEAALTQQDEWIRLAAAAVHLGTWEADLRTGEARVSEAQLSLYGLPPGSPLGFAEWLARVHPDDRAQVEAEIRTAFEDGTPYVDEFRILRVDTGEVRWIHARGQRLEGEDGRPHSFIGINLDITERKRAEAALHESENRLGRAIAAARIATWEVDLASDALHVSAGFDALFGQPPGSLRTISALLSAVHAEDRGLIRAAIERELASTDEADHEVEFRIPMGDGTVRWLRAQGRIERGTGGEPLRLIGVTHDITERHRAEQQISYMAYHDPLTDLANRRLFYQQLEQALARLRPGELLALHCVDLDQFKGVNDTLGHPAGDTLLRQAADRLRGCVRHGDVVARLGGDEFAIIQTALRGPDDAAALAQRIVEVLDEDYQIEDQQAVAGASIGIAVVAHEGVAPDEIVRNADIALYRAKADGRATFRFFECAMDEAVRRKQELRAGLRTAIDRSEIDLQFQPLVGIRAGEVTCFEALLRWHHPARGMITPAEFIPVAEETGLIMRMGAWVLRTACCEAARWPLPVRVAVNLSPVQFRNPGLLQAVTGALADSGLAAGRLELEITESVLLQDDQANLAILRELSALGVRIALDDFGTGFSSLGYLLRFPFDKIKIDRSFVMGLPERRESKAVIRAVVSMSRSLGISVTAEGVETAGQLDALRRLGCSDAQGYLFSRPVPAAEVTALIERLRRPEGLIA
jgi:diguanylate cyclase (GGDEF)-like protein/PAS domain S-box-containing protein